MNGHGDGARFGEKRPTQKDEWGNDKRQFSLMPFKVERACQCKDHVVLTYLIEQDTPSVSNPMELMQMMLSRQEIPTSKQWVPAIRVLVGYN